MFFRAVFIAILSVVSSSHAFAADPTPVSKSSLSFIASTDALSHNLLTSLPAHRLPAVTSNFAADQLPGNTLAGLREVYVWGWPLVYMSNLQRSMEMVRSAGRSGGAPVAPINNLCMLTDVVGPDFQSVPCPNRDVLYGFGVMNLKDQPVVVQVPDFGQRFWFYQIGDHRMESMGHVGSMYGTKPGFILIAGPDWQGEVPDQIAQVIRSRTNLAYIMPRVLATDGSNGSTNGSTNTSTVQESLRQVAMYPLSKFTGHMKRKDWTQARWYPAIGRTTRERSKFVQPEKFFEDLNSLIDEIEPSPAEEPLVELARQVNEWAEAASSRRAWLQTLATQLEHEVIAPMFDFAKAGQILPNNWFSLRNGAAFGDDHWSRTAIAKSNPFVNREQEAKYYYLEQSQDGERLQGGQRYVVHFPASQLPPADGFWSLTLYNQNHQFHSNTAERYSVGDAHQLSFNADGSLTIVIQPDAPSEEGNSNWLPSPTEGSFKLYLRLYQPRAEALNQNWVPPAARIMQ